MADIEPTEDEILDRVDEGIDDKIGFIDRAIHETDWDEIETLDLVFTSPQAGMFDAYDVETKGGAFRYADDPPDTDVYREAFDIPIGVRRLPKDALKYSDAFADVVEGEDG